MTPDQLSILPKLEERIASLEREAEAMGLPCATWGKRCSGAASEPAGELCTSCEHRQLSLG